MIDGVISFEPSQDAAERRGERRLVDADLVAAALHVSNSNAPSSPVVVDGDLLAGRVEQVDVHAGEAQLALLGLARDTAAGLEVAPHDAFDRAGLRRRRRRPACAPAGGLVGGIAVRPSCATPPGPTALVST